MGNTMTASLWNKVTSDVSENKIFTMNIVVTDDKLDDVLLDMTGKGYTIEEARPIIGGRLILSFSI